MNSKERRYNLRHYLLGAMPARLGDEMSGQAILLLGFAATQTAALGSTLLAGLTFSAALGGPLLGAALDRAHHPGRALAWALGFYALGLTLITLSLGHVASWISVVAALLVGFFMPAISGGWSSQLRSFVTDEQLVRASTIDATTFNIAGLVGPALAGILAVTFGAYWAVAVLVVLLAAALPMAWSLPKRPVHVGAHSNSFWKDVVAGFEAIVTNESLLRITLMSVISYLGIGMLWVICPLVGKELFGNVGYGGVLLSVSSVGALGATAAYAKWPMGYSSDRVAFMTTLILSAAMLILGFATSLRMAFVAMALVGLADGPQLAAIFAVRHREAPVRSRSQVFTTGASLKITAAALGAILAGRLASFSLRFTIMAACFAQLIAAASYIVVSLKSRKART